jgi:hypothetical protein
VNDRQELEIHDLETASRLLTALERLPAGSGLPSTVRQDLESLLGRDEEIDRLLAAETCAAADVWAQSVRRVFEKLSRTTGS